MFGQQGAGHDLQPAAAGGAPLVQPDQPPQQVPPRRTELALVLGDDPDAGTVHRVSFYGAPPQAEIETLVKRKVESALGPQAAFSLQDDQGADVVLSHTLPDGLRLHVVHEPPAAAAGPAQASVGSKRKRDAVDDTPATTPPVEPRGGGAAAARPLGEPSRARQPLPDPSGEQKAVIDAVIAGKCTSVASVAGSGKTTLMLQIARALPVGRHARIVTYNRVRPPYDRPDPLLKSSAPH